MVLSYGWASALAQHEHLSYCKIEKNKYLDASKFIFVDHCVFEYPKLKPFSVLEVWNAVILVEGTETKTSL